MKKKSLLDDVKALDYLIARLLKDESRMRNGQWIDAHRDILGVIGELERSRMDLIASVDVEIAKDGDKK